MVPVIQRMLDLLEMLEDAPGGMRLADFVARSGEPKTTIYRIVKTLEQRSYLAHDAVTGHYTLGPGLTRLGAKATRRGTVGDLVTASVGPMDALVEDTGLAAKLSILRDGQVLCIQLRSAMDPALVAGSQGRPMPLHAGAASKVLFAHLPENRRDAFLSGELRRYTSMTLIDPHVLRVALEEVRAQGWAFDDGEYDSTYCAVAAPVFDSADRVVAAVSLPFVAGTRTREQTDALRVAVQVAARAVSKRLGGTPSADDTLETSGEDNPLVA